MTSKVIGTDVFSPASLTSSNQLQQQSDSQLAISPVMLISMTNKSINDPVDFVNDGENVNEFQHNQHEQEEKYQAPNTVRVKNYENLNWSLNYCPAESTYDKNGKGNKLIHSYTPFFR